MNKEEKQLLLKDLCARLPYGIKANIRYCDLQGDEKIKYRDIDITYFNIEQVVNNWLECKLYLRPMSEIANLISAKGFTQLSGIELIDWYNANHIDYRGLIEKGLAIKVTEENNPYKE